MQIKERDLDILCDMINRSFGVPEKPFEKGKANIGNFHIDLAYGGAALHQIMSEGGGVNNISHGHMTKKELHNFMKGFLEGIKARKEINHEYYKD